MNSSRTDQDIVLSSRIRLARNIKGFHFSPSLSIEEKEILEKKILQEIGKDSILKDFTLYRINDLDELDRIVLKEKKIISERYYRQGSGLVLTDNEQSVSIVTGDLDHFRISTVMGGLSIDQALVKTSFIERQLAKHFDFAATDDEGYLTVNVSDSGTAMKGSVFLHLPVLCASDKMDHHIINTIETRLEVTGFSGGGAHSLGGLYLISNKNGFFPNELYLADLLNKTAEVFIEGERDVREDLLNGKYPELEDDIFRSLGTLKYCRQISEQEAISSLSMVRLGISIAWIKDITLDDINGVLSAIGNGFLRSFAYESNPDENDIMRLRAESIRTNLKFKS